MKKIAFTNPKFIKTAIHSKDYPRLFDPSGRPLQEVAVAGRSNVGKSSLLNHLFRSKGLVKTSSTPGKTQAINFFTLADQLAFVDLPGYGFAKVPESIRKNWGPMIQGYLENRKELKLILFLLDIRRTPNQEDIQFLAWASHFQKAVILVLTKVDKVSTTECQSNTAKILKALPFENLHHVHYSVLLNKGRDTLIRTIHQALESEEEEDGDL